MTENKISSIEKDVVVTLDYNLEVDGQEVDSGPIQFIFGHGNIIPRPRKRNCRDDSR